MIEDGHKERLKMENLKPTSEVYVGKWKGSKYVFQQPFNTYLYLESPIGLSHFFEGKSTLDIKCGYV